ncbi:L-methionine/branched-chain amino acid transporter [Pokkaliibacter sp. CJK22405]|uniref:L-methionine/branched-chain amino acid transporter n=1 Tax=Pokkaliibacter sp. CJK22405 TaxID=3384615 RepID=UPI003984F373
MTTLNKDIGLIQGIGLLATSLLGTSVFVVPAIAVSIAGEQSSIAWWCMLALILPVAFIFAKLGQQFPSAGGAPFLIGKALGKPAEAAFGILFLAAIPIGLPVALDFALGFLQAITPLTPGLVLAVKLGTLAVIWLICRQPPRLSGKVQTLIAIAIILCVLLMRALVAGETVTNDTIAHSSATATNWVALSAAMAVMIWCFAGIEAFIHMSEEFKNPHRDVPLALIGGVLVATLIYLFCSQSVWQVMGAITERQAGSAVPHIMEEFLGSPGLWLTSLLGFLACFASINAYTQGFSRLLWSIARDGWLPGRIGQLNQHGVPGKALNTVILICMTATTLTTATAMPVSQLLEFANGIFVLLYLTTMIAGVVLLRGFWRAIAMVASLLCALLCLSLGAELLYALCGLTLAFTLVYWRRSARARYLALAEQPVL